MADDMADRKTALKLYARLRTSPKGQQYLAQVPPANAVIPVLPTDPLAEVLKRITSDFGGTARLAVYHPQTEELQIVVITSAGSAYVNPDDVDRMAADVTVGEFVSSSEARKTSGNFSAAELMNA